MDWGIADITPLTLLDYPEKVACILWSMGCNMRCVYCYNAHLLTPRLEHSPYPSLLTPQGLEEFLTTRMGFLDGVVISGGECMLNKRLQDICRLAKDLNYSVKIDTNGTQPNSVIHLIESRLVDYIALDYKAPQHLFSRITRCHDQSYSLFSTTLDYLIQSRFPFEVRTTVHPDLLDESDVNTIIQDLHQRHYTGTYYLQHYYHTPHILGRLSPPQQRFQPDKLSKLVNVKLRNFSQ